LVKLQKFEKFGGYIVKVETLKVKLKIVPNFKKSSVIFPKKKKKKKKNHWGESEPSNEKRRRFLTFVPLHSHSSQFSLADGHGLLVIKNERIASFRKLRQKKPRQISPVVVKISNAPVSA
jgi:hypothetical protein